MRLPKLLLRFSMRSRLTGVLQPSLIKRILKRNGSYGPAEVYVRCRSKGYNKNFGSMCRQIRSKGYRKPKIHRKNYTNDNGVCLPASL